MELSKNLTAALIECGNYTDSKNRAYWWRVASMRKLEGLGLVEQHAPGTAGAKRRPYRITDVGRAYLTTDEG